MLVEHGFTTATDSQGRAWSWRPSFGRVSRLGSPDELIGLYAGLYESKAAEIAKYILVGLCDQEDLTPLIGWIDGDCVSHAGEMSIDDQILIARSLMRHGLVGKAKPKNEASGQYSSEVRLDDFVAIARVHLKMSAEDAEALSMTEFHHLFDTKYPDKKDSSGRSVDVPTRAQYEAAMKRSIEREKASG